MTRRNGIIAALTSMVGIMSGRVTVEAQPFEKSDDRFILSLPKGAVTFALDAYTKYIFVLDGKSVEFSPQEIMAALEDEGRHDKP